MTQSDLFPRQKAQVLRDKGIDRAATHAGQLWQHNARFTLDRYLLTLDAGDTFTAEDVREWGKVPEPPDRRAWGAVMLRAARAGRIAKFGYREHKDPSRHCGVSTLWRKR